MRFHTNSDAHPGGDVVKAREVAFKKQVWDNIGSNCYSTLCHQLHTVLNVSTGEAAKYLWWPPGEVEVHNRIRRCTAHHFSSWVFQVCDWVDVTCNIRRHLLN